MPLLQTWLLPNILGKKGVICGGHRDNQAIGAMTSNTKIFVFERCGINWKLQIKYLVLTPNYWEADRRVDVPFPTQPLLEGST